MTDISYFYSTTGQVVTSNSTLIQRSLYYTVIPPANLARVEIGASVIGFFNNAFDSCSNLTSIVFLGNSNCGSFGNWVFIGCSNLNNVVLPDTIAYMGEGSFYACTGLKNIVLSSSLGSLTRDTFNICSELRSIVIPSSVKTISFNVFRRCNKLKTIVFENPQTITSMEQTTFGGSTTGNPPIPGPATIVFYNTANSTALPSFMRPISGGVIWPSSSTFVYNSGPMKPTFVFSDGTSAYFNGTVIDAASYTSLIPVGQTLTNVYIGEQVTEISDNAFNGQSSLATIDFPTVSSLITMGNSVLKGCSALSSVTLPKNLATFGTGVFMDCINLVDCDLPLNLTSIPGNTFNGCSKLRTIIMPSTIATIGAGAFNNCTTLSIITFSQLTTTIESEAFMGCTSITSLVIPNSVSTIGTNAFNNCSNLGFCMIPFNPTYQIISEGLFDGCSKLASMIIPGQITTINANAFNNCSLLKNYIFENQINLLNVSTTAFTNGATTGLIVKYYKTANSTQLSSVTAGIEWPSTPTVQYSSLPMDTIYYFSNTTTNVVTISYSSTSTISRSSYTIPSGSNLTAVYIGETVTTISGDTFASTALATITFSTLSALTTIGTTTGNGAFQYTPISTILLPNTTTYLGINTFFGCGKLSTFNLPTNSSFTSIPSYCFFGSALNNITIPSNITSVGSYAFSQTQITSVVFPNSITYIGDYCFSNCTFFTSCTLPINSSFTNIRSFMFNQCQSLYSIIIPKFVTTIGDSVFYACRYLSSVTFSNQSILTSVSASSFSSALVYNPINVKYYNTATSANLSVTAQNISWGATVSNTYYSGPLETTFNYSDSSIDYYLGTSVNSTLYNSSKTLISATIGSNVRIIINDAFLNKTSLATINFSSSPSITYIGDNVFKNCSSIASITIPNLVSLLGSNVFQDCSSLTSCELSTILTTIPVNTFNNCSNLTSITIPTTVTTVGNNAFQSCSQLNSIDISRVTTLGTTIFEGCSNLTSCALSSSLIAIPDYMFSGCSRLVSITIPTAVRTMGINSFANCTTLSTIDLSNIETFGSGALSSTAITSCQLSSNLTIISTDLFAGCNSLSEIEIPPNVTTIESNAFLNCSRLAIIKFDNASVTNNKLTSVSATSGFSTVNSLGTPAYPRVTFYNAASPSALTTEVQGIAWPASTTITYNGGASCFAEGTKILCLNHNFEEEYIPIQLLRKGDLVKSYLHGYRKIDLIGKGYSVTDLNNFAKCMYKMVKTETNGLIENLLITGWHSILVDDLGEYEKDTIKLFNVPHKIDDKFLLPAVISKDFNKEDSINDFYYYHFILENNGNNEERFGIWANGILTETSTKTMFLRHEYMLLS